MQSEYPLSVLIVVPPWQGPVEQTDPTTPTGPPRPAAAAAATLSRYHGYMIGGPRVIALFPHEF